MTTLQDRLNTVTQRASALSQKLEEAAKIRSSFELRVAATELVTIRELADMIRERIRDEHSATILLESEDAVTRIEAKLESMQQAKVIKTQAATQCTELALPTVCGLVHQDKAVKYYCITASKAYGYGIFSAHDNKDDARYNAILTGGSCTYVDRNSEDGSIIEPHALREARRIASEYADK